MSGLSLICRHGSSLLAKRLIQKPDYRTFHHASFLLKDFTVVVPHMTESISEGTVSQLPKPVGSPVAVDEIVAVLETDKVSTPYVSPILVKKVHRSIFACQLSACIFMLHLKKFPHVFSSLIY
jgi:hypothetical protein